MARLAPRGRRWVFTINNYTPSELEELEFLTERLCAKDIKHLHQFGEKWQYCKYLVWEEERGQEGTPHIQGYIELQERLRRTQLSNMFPLQRAYLELARGTRRDNRNYCIKEENAREFADEEIDPELDHQENQWDRIKRLIKNNTQFKDIREQYPETALKYESGLRHWIHDVAIEQLEDVDEDLKQKNTWIYGKAGIGKSRLVRTSAGGQGLYDKPLNKWWDGYQGEGNVVLEDIDPPRAQILVDKIKVWGDRYKFTAEIKGGQTAISPSYKLWVTSNFSPEECFPEPQHLEAIRRRFRIVHMVSPQDLQEV